MSASELVSELQDLISRHGDLEVNVRNAAGDVANIDEVRFEQWHRSHTFFIEG